MKIETGDSLQALRSVSLERQLSRLDETQREGDSSAPSREGAPAVSGLGREEDAFRGGGKKRKREQVVPEMAPDRAAALAGYANCIDLSQQAAKRVELWRLPVWKEEKP